MIFLLLHALGYSALVSTFAQAARKYRARIVRRSKREVLLRITKLEHEVGVGIDWALDRIGDFGPVYSRPRVPGYSSLHQYAFRCYGCDKEVVYADYDESRFRVRDRRHLLCDKCLPVERAA